MMILATEMAAQVWCDKRVSNREMDTVLATVIAEKFDEILNQARLGCATTKELLTELCARADVGGYGGYRTADIDE